MKLSFYIKKIKKDGYVQIPGLLSKSECTLYRNKSKKLINKYKKRGKKLSSSAQIINSPFRHDKSFFKLIYNKKIDKILSKLIDQDYVLLNSNIINRKIDIINTQKLKTIGEGWHTDTPTVGKKKLSNGFRFLLTVMLNDFTKENGATYFVPKSHLLEIAPRRDKNYKSKILTGSAGDAVIFDSSLWHKAGKSNSADRFSVFNLYGPWWNKPYFDYEKMLGNKFFKKTSKKIKKLLHFNSRPPKNNDIRSNTVTK